MKFNNGLNINAEPDMFVVAKKKKTSQEADATDDALDGNWLCRCSR